MSVGKGQRVGRTPRYGIAPTCCAPTRQISEESSERPHKGVRTGKASVEGMIALPGGTFLMGTEDGQGFPRTEKVRCARSRSTLSTSQRT